MSVAGQMVVGDSRPFTTQISANASVPDLTVVTDVYLYVLRGSGAVQRWGCFITGQTASQLLASYSPGPTDNNVAGETIHLRPYLIIPSMPDTPCVGYEIQVVRK